MQHSSQPPLCVDLDGTLVATDTLWESFLILVRENVFVLFLLPFWLVKGKAYFKHQIAQRVTLPVETLPYREEVINFLKTQKSQGRYIVLATAAHQNIANGVATYLQLFDEVIASDKHSNMKSKQKRDTLQQKFGDYDYIGDSSADLPILHTAQQKYLVSPSRLLRKNFSTAPIFEAPKVTLKTWLRALRPHQWVKNTLLFVPLTLSHQLFHPEKLYPTLIGFAAFCLVASAGYILNDLLDLSADRSHLTKKERPFASGMLSIPQGLVLFVSLLFLGVSLAFWYVSFAFVSMVLLYLVMTITYSFYLKRKMILDVMVLAGLYTHRLFAGGIAADTAISSWLMAFSMFIFASLAFLKRYTELLQLSEEKIIKNRNYSVDDIEMIASMGPTSGYLAILVFALYISGEDVALLYPASFFLWFICPLLLYWITRVWFIAHRKQMVDDPVWFALTDSTSWFVMVSIFGLILLAKFL